jgi:hypothetical protein
MSDQEDALDDAQLKAKRDQEKKDKEKRRREEDRQAREAERQHLLQMELEIQKQAEELARLKQERDAQATSAADLGDAGAAASGPVDVAQILAGMHLVLTASVLF